MEIDIKERILKDFGTEAEKAMHLLSEFEKKAQSGPRINRCIVHLADGDIAKLKKAIKDVETDWRDVILWAESTDFEFNKPFKT